MNNKEKITDVSKLSNEDLINEINETNSFIKYITEEIKKTDIGDKDEQDE